MDDVCYAVADTAHLEAAGCQVFLYRLEVLLVGYEKLHVVSCGKAEMTAAEFFCNFADLADCIS